MCPVAMTQAQAVLTNTIAWTQTPPQQSEVDLNHTVYYEYTLTQTRTVMVAIVKCDRNGTPIVPISQSILNQRPATTQVPVRVSGNLYVPPGVVPSSQLPNGQHYRWEASIRGTGNVLLYASYSPLTIGSPLGVNTFADTKIALYPNPVSDLLFLPENIPNEQITVTDSGGRVVFSGIHNGVIEVAEFSEGVYFLITDSGKTAKFVKF